MSLKEALRMSGPNLEDFPRSGELFFRQTRAFTQAQGLKIHLTNLTSQIPICSNVFYIFAVSIHVYYRYYIVYMSILILYASTLATFLQQHATTPYTPCKRSPVYALRTASCKPSREATAFSRAARARASDHIQFQPQKEPSKKMNKVSHSKSR